MYDNDFANPKSAGQIFFSNFIFNIMFFEQYYASDKVLKLLYTGVCASHCCKHKASWFVTLGIGCDQLYESKNPIITAGYNPCLVTFQVFDDVTHHAQRKNVRRLNVIPFSVLCLISIVIVST